MIRVRMFNLLPLCQVFTLQMGEIALKQDGHCAIQVDEFAAGTLLDLAIVHGNYKNIFH